MKITSSIFVMIFLLFIACNRKQDDPVTAAFDASVQSVGGDCQLPLLDFGSRTAEVKKMIGSDATTTLYYALNLDPTYAKAGTSLLVTIRKVTANEERACTTMGPAYPSITVTSAVAK